MKIMLKRWISILLVITVFVLIAIPAALGVTNEIIRVYCVSNLYNTPDSAIDLMLANGEVYIRAEDAALYSGFILEESNTKPQFVREDIEVDFDNYLSDGTDRWIPLFKGMELLDTQVQLDGYVLWFTARMHTFQDLREITDQLVSSPYFLEDLFKSNVGELGKFGVWLINLVSNDPVEELMKSIGGDLAAGDATQSKEDYENVIAMLLEGSANDPYLQGIEIDYEFGKNVLKAVKKIVKAVNTLEKIDKKMLELAENKELMDLLEEASYQDIPGGFLAGILGSKTMKYYIGISSGNSRKSIANKIEDYTSNTVKIDGYGLSDQLDIAQYMYSLYSASTAYRDMFINTYFADEDNINYAPKLAQSIIKDIKKAASDSKTDDIWTLITEETTSVLKDSTASTVKNLLKKEMSIGTGESIIYSLANKAVVFCFEAASGFKMKDSTKYIERGVALTEIQSGIKKLYDDCKDDPENALVVKYSALMYARCYQLAYEMLCDVDNITPIIHNHQELILLSQISDRDLTAEVSNKTYSADELHACGELYLATKGYSSEEDDEERMELTDFLGMPLDQLMKKIPDCVETGEGKKFSTPKAEVQGYFDTNITSISLIFSNSSVLQYQICGIYPSMHVQHALNALSSQGFQMENDGNKWFGSSGNIELTFFETLGNSISHISAKEKEQGFTAADFEKYLGKWKNDEEELTIFISDYDEDSFTFDLEAYRLNGFVNQQAVIVSNATFEFYAKESYDDTAMRGKIYFAEDCITLSVSYNSMYEMDFLVGRDIVFTPCLTKTSDTVFEAAHYLPLSPRAIARDFSMEDTGENALLDLNGGLSISVEDDEITQMVLEECGTYSLFGVQVGMSEQEAITAMEKFNVGELIVGDILWDGDVVEAKAYYNGSCIGEIVLFDDAYDYVERINVFAHTEDIGGAYSAKDLAYYMTVPHEEFSADIDLEMWEEVYNPDSIGYENEINGLYASIDNSTGMLDCIQLQHSLNDTNQYTLFGVKPGMSIAEAEAALEAFNDYGMQVEDIYYEEGIVEAWVTLDGAWLADIWVYASYDLVYEIDAVVTEGGIGWYPLYTAVVVNCNDWVSLREYDDTEAPRLATVPLGADVDVYEVGDEFSYCKYDGEWGYILNEYLAEEGIAGVSETCYICRNDMDSYLDTDLWLYSNGSFEMSLPEFGNVYGSYTSSSDMTTLFIESMDFSGCYEEEYEELYFVRENGGLTLDSAYAYGEMLYDWDIMFGYLSGGSFFERA